MTCYKPLHAYRSSSVNPTGKRSLVFNPSQAENTYKSLTIPCGQCIGCRLDRSRQWATRISLENELHDQSIFLTLTYDDDHLPSDGSLHPDDLSDFIKNLRRQIEYHYGKNKKIRFFGCGEYGDQFSRPHYHVIIFGWSPSDKKRWSKDLFTSQFIEKIWKKGWCPFGSVTFESAAYVARYVTKKITGPIAQYVYDGLEPEFVRMSRRPGIAREWLDKYKDDVLRDDYIVVRDGIKVKPPKYFDKIFEKYFPDIMEDIKEKRILENYGRAGSELESRDIEVNRDYYYKYLADRKSFRELEDIYYEHHVLPVKETVKKAQVCKLKRGFENGSM